MTNYNHVYSLYVFAFISVGPALTLLTTGFRKKGMNIFMILPAINLVFVSLYMLIDMNMAWGPEISPQTLRILVTIQFLCDMIGAVSLGWAYVLRLRVVIRSGIMCGDYPHYSMLLIYACAFMPTVYPAVDIVGIVSIWNSDLAGCCAGNLNAFLYGSFNVAWAVNDLVMEFSFAYILLTRLRSLPKKLQFDFGITAFCLSFVSLGLLAGGIVTFFQQQLGTQIIYAFWMVNCWVFLIMNRQLGRVIEKSRSTGATSSTSPSPSYVTSP